MADKERGSTPPPTILEGHELLYTPTNSGPEKLLGTPITIRSFWQDFKKETGTGKELFEWK